MHNVSTEIGRADAEATGALEQIFSFGSEAKHKVELRTFEIPVGCRTSRCTAVLEDWLGRLGAT